MPRISLKKLYALKSSKVGITAITAYDASFAKFFDNCGVDIILIGDSLGEVIKGEKNTHKVTLDEMIYHTSAVCRSTKSSYLIADLPRESCKSINRLIRDAKKLFRACKINMLKIEINSKNIHYLSKLHDEKIPVCCHLGLTPQYVTNRKSFRKYGKCPSERIEIIKNACLAEKLGAKILLLECVSDEVVNSLKTIVKIPIIGIGSGKSCDGQIIVCYDLLGISYNQSPSFLDKKYFSIPSFHARLNKYISNVKKFT